VGESDACPTKCGSAHEQLVQALEFDLQREAGLAGGASTLWHGWPAVCQACLRGHRGPVEASLLALPGKAIATKKHPQRRRGGSAAPAHLQVVRPDTLGLRDFAF
jgi:hypothetical protein